jgi:dTDP-glucose pyrophosphorylase
MKAVILAAGRGARMRPLTCARPKALIPVAGRPLLEHVIAGLVSQGVHDFLVVIGYLGDQIESHFGTGEALGCSITYRLQPEATGSGHAALLAEDFAAGEPFLLSFADILTGARNYHRLLEKSRTASADAIIGINWMEDPYAGAAVYVEGDRVVRLVEKPPRGAAATNWNNAGVMVLTPIIFDALRRIPRSPRGEYELPQAVARLVEAGRDVLAVPFEGLRSDVADPEEVLRLNALAQAGGLDLS